MLIKTVAIKAAAIEETAANETAAIGTLSRGISAIKRPEAVIKSAKIASSYNYELIADSFMKIV